MQNAYDPWAHAIRIFVNRVFMFLALTMTLGLAAWWTLLHYGYAMDGVRVARATLAVVRDAGTALVWRLLLGQCVVIGALATACLFIALILASRLRRAERHLRGTRVVAAGE